MKTRKQTLINGEGNTKNVSVPENLGHSDTRIKVQIPKNTKLYEFLKYPKKKYNCRQPAWKKLEELLIISEQSREEWAEKIFDEFIIRLALFFPDKKEQLQKIRQLVIWQILEGEELTDAYYESLKKLR